MKYVDADGQQVQETIGAERDGATRKRAEAELRERLVRVERKGLPAPRPLTFAECADGYFAEGQSRRAWEPATVKVYRKRARAVPEADVRPLAAR